MINKRQPTPIIILGMHRSGTSCLAGSLEQAGVYFGDTSHYNPHNKKGNRENNQIMKLNDSILSFNKSSWSQPPLKKLEWTSQHIMAAKDIVRRFELESSNRFWGFKDPRTLLTLEFWNTILPNKKMIGSIREPLKVAQSLNRRSEEFHFEKGLKLWLHYNKILLKILNQEQFPIISFDLKTTAYQKKVREINDKLLLPYPDKNSFFDNKLRSNTTTIDYQLPSSIIDCHNKLLAYSV